MRRLPLLPLLLLTLTLLAACGPRTVDRGPSLPPSTVNGPSSTVSPTTPTVDRGLWTVTPTAYPLSSIISPDLQHTLESRQGWTFRWDAGRSAYLITQRAWDADKAQFTSSTLGEIGYIDAEGILHLHSTSFTARPGEKSAFVTDQSHADITLDLKDFASQAAPTVTMTVFPPTATAKTPTPTAKTSKTPSATTTPHPEKTTTNTPTPEKKSTQTATLTPEATATQTATPENNARETQLGPFTFVDTKNPLFEKTGILKVTDKNGNTYVYSAASALTGEKTINGKKVKVAEFASLEKNDQGVMALSLDALHTGFAAAWFEAIDYPNPFMITKDGKLVFDDEIIKTPPQYSIRFNLDNDAKVASLRSRSLDLGAYTRLIRDENGEVVKLFVTDEKGNSYLTLPLRVFNPSDYNHPNEKDIMTIFAAFGTTTPEQLENLQEKYFSNKGANLYDLIKPLNKMGKVSPFVIHIAQENDYFEKNAGAWDAYFDQRPLDSLLAGEGNDVKTKLWDQSNGAYANISGNLGYLDQLSTTNTVLETQGMKDELPPNLQLLLLALGF